MWNVYKICILFLFAISSSFAINLQNCTVPKKGTASKALNEECPAHSQCMPAVDGTFKCICLPNFQHNQSPESLPKLEHAFIPYCRLKNGSDSSTLTPTAGGESKVMIYIRTPAKTEHLIFAILLILFGVILVITVTYVIKLLRPLKRTKIAYVKLKRRKNKHKRLVEEGYEKEAEEVYEGGIAMTRRNEDAQYY